MENVYDVLDLYLWLSFRFPSTFPYKEQVHEMRIELEKMIDDGIEKMLDQKKRIRRASKSLNSLPTKKQHSEKINENSFENLTKLKGLKHELEVNQEKTELENFNSEVLTKIEGFEKKLTVSESKHVNNSKAEKSNESTTSSNENTFIDKIDNRELIYMKSNPDVSQTIESNDSKLKKISHENVKKKKF